jgi:hypothetical protein
MTVTGRQDGRADRDRTYDDSSPADFADPPQQYSSPTARGYRMDRRRRDDVGKDCSLQEISEVVVVHDEFPS